MVERPASIAEYARSEIYAQRYNCSWFTPSRLLVELLDIKGVFHFSLRLLLETHFPSIYIPRVTLDVRKETHVRLRSALFLFYFNHNLNWRRNFIKTLQRHIPRQWVQRLAGCHMNTRRRQRAPFYVPWRRRQKIASCLQSVCMDLVSSENKRLWVLISVRQMKVT